MLGNRSVIACVKTLEKYLLNGLSMQSLDCLGCFDPSSLIRQWYVSNALLLRCFTG